MTVELRPQRRESHIMTDRLRFVGGWLAMAIMAGGVAGCGLGGTSTTPDASATGTDASVADGSNANVGDEPSSGGNGNPGIMVTPAAGGGIVVGDPLDGGRAASLPAGAPGGPQAASPRSARAEEEEPAPAQTPAPALPSARPVLADSDNRSEDDFAAPARPNASATPLVEPGDEPPPVAANGPLGTGVPGRVGALADDKGAFVNSPRDSGDKREDSEAATEAFPPGTVGPEDVDAPPVARIGGNARLEREGRSGEDGDERFDPAAAQGQAAGTIEIKRGSAEEVATSFLNLVAAGEIEKAVPLIAGRATGLLGKLRDGTATPEEIEELKAVAAIRQQENNRPKGGTHRLITYRADKKMLVVEAEQKETDSTVFRLEVRDAPRRRK